MGRHFEPPLARLVADLGPSELHAYIDEASLDPKYARHTVSALQRLGVSMAPSAAAANFIVSGYAVRGSDGMRGLRILSRTRGTLELFPDDRAMSRPQHSKFVGYPAQWVKL